MLLLLLVILLQLLPLLLLLLWPLLLRQLGCTSLLPPIPLRMRVACARNTTGPPQPLRACRMRKRLLSRSTPLPLSSSVTSVKLDLRSLM